MAYELHIVRTSPIKEGDRQAIALAEWKAILAETKGVRLMPVSTVQAINPETGEVVTVIGRDGDAEVYFSDTKTWQPVFRWFGGAVHFKALFAPAEGTYPVLDAAVELAMQLNAVLRGDHGELYDLHTAQVTDPEVSP